MSSMVNVFVHAMCKCSKKCLAQKVDNLGSLKLIHMIQSLLNSSCVVLQYKPGTLFFFIKQFLSYTATKKTQKFQYNCVVFLYIFSEDSGLSEDYSHS